ncbi:hypothetical protein E2R55_13480 [Vibrio vulnificus]|nr:hypothetical protein E2R55_13480 [Vibrio vulnificus]
MHNKKKRYKAVSDCRQNGVLSTRRETPAGNASPGETPQAQKSRGGSRTARGKRVPRVESNGSSFTNKKTAGKLAFPRVRLQSVTAIKRFNVLLNRHS